MRVPFLLSHSSYNTMLSRMPGMTSESYREVMMRAAPSLYLGIV